MMIAIRKFDLLDFFQKGGRIAPMKPNKSNKKKRGVMKVGKRVYWIDPDRESDCSGWGKITHMPPFRPLNDDDIISLRMESGGEVEALVKELSDHIPNRCNVVE